MWADPQAPEVRNSVVWADPQAELLLYLLVGDLGGLDLDGAAPPVHLPRTLPDISPIVMESVIYFIFLQHVF